MQSHNPCTFWGKPPHRGISLAEIALMLLIASIALIPVMGNAGSKTQATGNNTSVLDATRQQSKMVTAANSLMESALTGQIAINDSPFGNLAANSMNTTNMVPQGGTYTSSPYRFDEAGDLYYQWVLKDVSYRKNNANQFIDNWGRPVVGTPDLVRRRASIPPDENRIISATLKIYGTNPSSGSTPPAMVLPTFFFAMEDNVQVTDPKTGIVVVLDVSGSMAWPTAPGALGSVNGVASPFLRDRFFRTPASLPADPTQLAQVVLDPQNNSELDLVFSSFQDDPATQFDERYLLGAGGVGAGPNILDNDCDLSTDMNQTNFNAPGGIMPFLYAGNIMAGNNTNGTNRRAINRLCSTKLNQADADAKVNANISRIEAARSAMVSFLLALEGNQNVANNMSLGYVTFQSENQERIRVPMETATATPDPLDGFLLKPRFVENRTAFLMTNRDGSQSTEPAILQGGGTWIYGGLQAADRMLNPTTTTRDSTDLCRIHDPGGPYSNKIIVLISDGEPSPSSGRNTRVANPSNPMQSGLVQTADCMGRHNTTIFTIGVIGDDPQTMSPIATFTTGGQYFRATEVSELRRIFDQLAQQVERNILLAAAQRYQVDYDW